MPRPDPWRLDPARYPHRRTLPTRFQDLDPLGHINNVAYAALFETGRIHFNHAIDLLRWKHQRWLVAATEINYLAEGHFPADVEIATGIGAIRTRSWQILSLMLQEGRPIATCDVVLVASAADGGLPDDMRAALAAVRIAG
jgi:acyl-CoA thioester hydrolase